MSTMEAKAPQEVTQQFVTMGVSKAAQSLHVTFFKGWMGGWQLCFGAMLVQLVHSGCPALRSSNPAIVSLLAASLFPVGLLMLFLTGNELLTAHLMFMPMSFLKRKIRLWQVLVNWLIVFVANLAGVLCFVAFMVKYSGLYADEDLTDFSKQVAVAKTSQGWGACLLRGIGCNFLVCTAIWLGKTGRDTISKVAGIYIPTALFVFLNFEHVIVNMYYIPVGILMGAPVGTGTYITQSLLPSLIGNYIGGCLLGMHMLLIYDTPDLSLPRFSIKPDSTVAKVGTSAFQSPSGDTSLS